MKMKRLFCLILCVCLAFAAVFPVSATDGNDETATSAASTEPTQTAPTAVSQPTLPPALGADSAGIDASVTNGCHSLDAQVPLRADSVLTTGKAGLVYEVNCGTLVYGSNIDSSFSPGSFVKLMTTIVALEKGTLSQSITVTQENIDHVPEDSSTFGLEVGEELTLEQLLYCMVLDSANDAAVVIAEHLYGDQPSFVAAMNEQAAKLGCTATNFTNVHGIQDASQYTTPRDLAKIVNYGLQNEFFVKLIGTDRYTLETNVDHAQNTVFSDNYMLSQVIDDRYVDDRCTGGKAASNAERQRSLIITAEQNGLSYIAIVMETQPVFDDEGGYTIDEYREFPEMAKLLDLAFDQYEGKQILYEGQVASRLPVTGGANAVAATPTRSVRSVLPASVGMDGLTMHYLRTGGSLTAPVKAGDVVDILQIWYGAVCIAQSELVAMNDSKFAEAAEDPQSPSADVWNSGALTKVLAIFGMIVGVVLGFILILYIIRWVRTAMLRSKRRRRRNARRRSR